MEEILFNNSEHTGLLWEIYNGERGVWVWELLGGSAAEFAGAEVLASGTGNTRREALEGLNAAH